MKILWIGTLCLFTAFLFTACSKNNKDENGQQNGQEEQVLTYTVTKDVWEATTNLGQYENISYEKRFVHDWYKTNIKQVFNVTNSAIGVDRYSNDELESKGIYIAKDGDIYLYDYSKSYDKYYDAKKYQYGGASTLEDTSEKKLPSYYSVDDMFESFVYDEENKEYTATLTKTFEVPYNETGAFTNSKFVLKFANDKLISFEIINSDKNGKSYKFMPNSANVTIPTDTISRN